MDTKKTAVGTHDTAVGTHKKQQHKPVVELAPLLPHGQLEAVFDNIWMVTGQMNMPMSIKMTMSRNMTIVRNPDTQTLCLINTVRLSEAGLQALDALGKVTTVIRLAGYHGRDDAFFQQHYGAKVYAIEGQVYAREMDVHKNDYEPYMQPDVWMKNTDDLPLDNAQLHLLAGAHPPEAVLLLEQNEGVLVAGDCLQNMAKPDEYVNFPMRIMMRLSGFFKAFNVGPFWLKLAKPNKSAVRSLLELDFEHVLPAHGDPVLNAAKRKYAPVINGDLRGGREA